MDVSKIQQPTPIVTTRRRTSSPVLLVMALIISVGLLLVGYIVFIKPDTGPATALFNKVFPAQSGIIQLEQIDLDVNSIVTNPVFGQLKEYGPIPLQLTALGKANPFI